ncbi:MAG: hypothetical protein ACRDT6_26120, partial [Micromonosporaceae bacterium]
MLNGHNHHAVAIEESVAAVGGVVPGRVAAVGVPDPETGTERLVICFVPADPAAAPVVGRAVADAVFRRWRLTARAVAVPAAEFPVTASGKVRRAALRD